MLSHLLDIGGDGVVVIPDISVVLCGVIVDSTISVKICKISKSKIEMIN